MSSSDRQVWQVFVQLADTLVADFDVIDFLHTLAQHRVDLLGVSRLVDSARAITAGELHITLRG